MTDSGHRVLHQAHKNKVIRDVFPTKLGCWGAENGGNSNIWKNMDFFLLFSDCNNSLQVSQK